MPQIILHRMEILISGARNTKNGIHKVEIEGISLLDTLPKPVVSDGVLKSQVLYLVGTGSSQILCG